MKLEFIPELRHWWKFWSVRFWIVVATMAEISTLLPDSVVSGMPEWAAHSVAGLSGISIFLRLLKQNGLFDTSMERDKINS